MHKKKYWYGGAALALAALFIFMACQSPTGGEPPIFVSGTVNPADLSALGLKPGETAALQFYSPQGEKIGEVQISGGGTWSAEIPVAYKNSEIRVVLVVPTPGGERVLEYGKITTGGGGTPVIDVTIPGTAEEYTITKAGTENGTFAISREKALKGETITVSASPASGYKVKDVAVSKTGNNETIPTLGAGANRWTFTMPAAAVTVGVNFIAENFSPEEDVVDAFVLDGKVTAPVRDDQPVTTPIDGTQYTGTVEWQTTDGTAHTGAFAPSTVYKALVTLTAKTGCTFTGVTADSFTFTGATSVTNAVNGGTVTITFPATADMVPNATIPIGNPSVKLYRDNGTTPLENNGTTTINTETGIVTIRIDAGSDDEIIWYLNGNEITAARDKTSISLSKRTPGTYLITVEATPGSGIKQSGAHTFVIE
jgi:hypothetical protein